MASLEQGVIPWRKPWTAGIPLNAISKRPYSGINAMPLGLAPYSDSRWVTFKQAGQLGGNVRKGEKSTLVIFWKQSQVVDEDTDETKTRRVLKYYRVFNAE